MNNLRIYKKIALIAFLFSIDRAAKHLALKTLSESEGFFVSDGLGLKLFLNDRFFGLARLSDILAVILPSIFLFLIISLLINDAFKGKRGRTLFLGIALAGAISNAQDRLSAGAVIDFIVLGPWIINLADLFIITGILFYLWPQMPKSNERIKNTNIR